MDRAQIMNKRKQMFDDMEKRLQKNRNPEDFLFYSHSNEDRIVLSHALFWVMTQNMGKIVPVLEYEYLLLLRKYQEEMLDAYLTESDEFSELLRYCTFIYETLPNMILEALAKDFRYNKPVRKLMAVFAVAAGYAGDMDEDMVYELLDDMDFSFNKVYCRKIVQMLPLLNKMVEAEFQKLQQLI